MPQRYEDEDMDDILSSIMHGQQANPGPRHTRSTPAKRHRAKAARTPGRPKSFKAAFLLIPLALAVGAAALYLLISSENVPFMPPKSPFNAQIKEGSRFPLIFPSALPAGFTIDQSSVSKASDGSIVYSLKDNDAGVISISLQSQPDGLNLQPLIDTMTDVREITVPAGNTVIGLTTDNMVTTNTLSGEVWIIVRYPKDLITDAELDAMLRSFRKD